jgi:hypothetical protein
VLYLIVIASDLLPLAMSAMKYTKSKKCKNEGNRCVNPKCVHACLLFSQEIKTWRFAPNNQTMVWGKLFAQRNAMVSTKNLAEVMELHIVLGIVTCKIYFLTGTLVHNFLNGFSPPTIFHSGEY